MTTNLLTRLNTAIRQEDQIIRVPRTKAAQQAQVNKASDKALAVQRLAEPVCEPATIKEGNLLAKERFGINRADLERFALGICSQLELLQIQPQAPTQEPSWEDRLLGDLFKDKSINTTPKKTFGRAKKIALPRIQINNANYQISTTKPVVGQEMIKVTKSSRGFVNQLPSVAQAEKEFIPKPVGHQFTLSLEGKANNDSPKEIYIVTDLKFNPSFISLRYQPEGLKHFVSYDITSQLLTYRLPEFPAGDSVVIDSTGKAVLNQNSLTMTKNLRRALLID